MLCYFIPSITSIVLTVVSCSLNAEAETIDSTYQRNQGRAVMSYKDASINTKYYPPIMQEYNRLFEVRCGTCHNLQLTIQAPGVLPSYWEETVQRMVELPNSNISREEAQTITTFLIYDSAIRRKRDVQAQMTSLPEVQRRVEQAKIDRIKKEYVNSGK